MDIDIKITFKRLHYIVDTTKSDIVNIPNGNIIVDELLGTREKEKWDCEADERKRIKERPSGLVTLKPP